MMLRLLLSIYIFLFYAITYAAHPLPVEDVLIPIEKKTPIQFAFDSPAADWIFTGSVKNEEGEDYHYYLQILRRFEQIQAVALLVNAQSNQVILFEQSQSTLDSKEIQPLVWSVGQTFLRFNSINNSWVFGSRSVKDKSGFNFKVDMLGKLNEMNTKQQDLRSGRSLLVGQTGSLNGHISLQGNDSFVTADKAWFRQTWAGNNPEKTSVAPFTTIFCDFEDGAGFYAMDLRSDDALRESVVGWRDAGGNVQPISQFVTAKKLQDGMWSIQIPFPKLQFSLKNNVSQLHIETDPDKIALFAGSITGKKAGFCSISEHSFS